MCGGGGWCAGALCRLFVDRRGIPVSDFFFVFKPRQRRGGGGLMTRGRTDAHAPHAVLVSAVVQSAARFSLDSWMVGGGLVRRVFVPGT